MVLWLCWYKIQCCHLVSMSLIKLQLKEHMLQTLKLLNLWQTDYVSFQITLELFQKRKSDFIKCDSVSIKFRLLCIQGKSVRSDVFIHSWHKNSAVIKLLHNKYMSWCCCQINHPCHIFSWSGTYSLEYIALKTWKPSDDVFCWKVWCKVEEFLLHTEEVFGLNLGTDILVLYYLMFSLFLSPPPPVVEKVKLYHQALTGT